MIKISDLKKSFNGKKVLDGVNLDIDSEEIREHFESVANLARFVSTSGE